jgi:CheY-like chemotaxis protein
LSNALMAVIRRALLTNGKGVRMAARQTILVVDDDPDTRELMTMWLDTAGYAVHAASNGREALGILETERPSAMVVDSNMPMMDGAELRRHQQGSPATSSVPFILVSGAWNAARIAHDLGIVDVVTKPVDAARLLAIIAGHCNRAH